MKKFRKKDLSKGLDYLKKHPTIPLVGLGSTMSTANYITNSKRHKEDQVYQKEQLKAMKDLTRVLGNTKKSMESVNNSLEKIKESPIPNNTSSSKFFRYKLFSIESGKYEGTRRKVRKTSITKGSILGAGIGAITGGLMGVDSKASGPAALGFGILGAGLGAFTAWMSNLADESEFNLERSSNVNSYTIITRLKNIFDPKEDEVLIKNTVSEEKVDEFGITSKNTSEITSKRPERLKAESILYDIDKDPKNSVVSVLCRGGVVVMYVNKPFPEELMLINRSLDSYCKYYKNADYKSTKIGKRDYVVEVGVVEGSEHNIILDLIRNGVKVNILTGQRFGTKGL